VLADIDGDGATEIVALNDRLTEGDNTIPEAQRLAAYKLEGASFRLVAETRLAVPRVAYWLCREPGDATRQRFQVWMADPEMCKHPTGPPEDPRNIKTVYAFREGRFEQLRTCRNPHWMDFRASERHSGRIEIRLRLADGEDIGFLSPEKHVVHFTLGFNWEAPTVEIVWPDGQKADIGSRAAGPRGGAKGTVGPKATGSAPSSRHAGVGRAGGGTYHGTAAHHLRPEPCRQPRSWAAILK
jgi:hypothetical protein